MKTLPLSKYFEIKNPNYVFLKLTPNNSIRNYDSHRIAKAIASVYKTIMQRIRTQNKKLFFEAPSKIAYYIYIEKTNVEFYFIVPDSYLNLLKEKITDTWKGITVTKVSELPNFSLDAIKFKLSYKKEDALSLAIDRRTNTLLSSIVNIVDVIDQGDKVGVFYNFMPTSQYGWRANYLRTLDKIEKNMPVEKDKTSLTYALKLAASIIMAIADTVFDAIGNLFGESKEQKKMEVYHDTKTQITDNTRNKKDSTILETQMIVLSESKNKINALNTAYSVCQAFKTITADNELVYRKENKKVDLLKYDLGTDRLKMSTLESQNLIALPGREILEEYKMINKIDTYESEVPKELTSGVMCIGDNTYRGKDTKAYLTTDKEYRNLTLCVCAPTRAGKTTFFQNIIKNAIDNNECVIIPDYIDNNQFSSDIEKVIPKEKSRSVDCADLNRLEGMGYNEMWIETNNPLQRYDMAKEQTAQLTTLVDIINGDNKELSAKMDRYLEASCNIVFINRGTFLDVVNVLKKHQVRSEFIKKVPKELMQYVGDYIETLQELDEIDKKNNEVIGTKLSYVSGILDRMNKLNKNTAMEMMLKNNCSNNINFVDEIQKGQLITIKMPESRYKTKTEKDFMTTYWLSKIWMALQIRSNHIQDRNKRIKVNIVIDELYQVPQAQKLLADKLSQIAKFDCKIIISCHYLGQIPIIRDELKAANSSYMLISGCDKDNFKELKEELSPYELEDLLNLKRYHSLNLLRYEKGYAKFITKLPKPIN